MNKELFEKVKRIAKRNNLNVIDYLRTKDIVPKKIKEFIKERRYIIHGGKAINVQAHFPYKRASFDYDVYSNTPLKDANALDKLLDKARRGNYHYVKSAAHKGTYKVMDIGFDLKKGTEDDFGWVDFTKKPKTLKLVEISGVLYSTLAHVKKRKGIAIRAKKYEYRSKKDIADIERIEMMEKKKLFEGGNSFW